MPKKTRILALPGWIPTNSPMMVLLRPDQTWTSKICSSARSWIPFFLWQRHVMPDKSDWKISSYETFWQTILCLWIVCVQCLNLTTKTDRKSSIIKLHWVSMLHLKHSPDYSRHTERKIFQVLHIWQIIIRRHAERSLSVFLHPQLIIWLLISQSWDILPGPGSGRGMTSTAGGWWQSDKKPGLGSPPRAK